MLLTHFEKTTKKFESPYDQLKAIALASFDFYKKHPYYFELIAIYEVNNKLEETEEIQASINRLIHFVTGIAQKAKETQRLFKPL